MKMEQIISSATVETLKEVPWFLVSTTSVSAIILANILMGFYGKFKVNKKIKKKQAAVSEKKLKLMQKLAGMKKPFDNANVYTKYTIEELKKKIDSGELQVVDILEAFQAKALSIDQEHNCIIDVVYDADVTALYLDSIDKSERGPLHGIPVSIKDHIGIEGYDALIGCSSRLFVPLSESSVIVQVLRELGAVPFVLTNMPQLGLSVDTRNPIFGETTNPHSLKHTCGGSSGGEGCLIGGGGSPLGFGTDIGGSLRIPATHCGICSLKPTAHRLSTKGIFELSPCVGSLEVAVGPMAPDVDTLVSTMKALLSNTMFQMDGSVPPMVFNASIFTAKKPLRIGYYTSLGGHMVRPVPAVIRAVMQAKQALESRGHTLVEISVPDIEDAFFQFVIQNLASDAGQSKLDQVKGDIVDECISNSIFVSKIPTCLRWILGTLIRPFLPLISRAVLATNGHKNTLRYFHMVDNLKSYQIKFADMMRDTEIDCIICPTAPSAAPRLGASKNLVVTAAYSAIYNVLDYPAGVVPVTKVTSADLDDLSAYASVDILHRYVASIQPGSEGLPVGVQCVAPQWQEELCLRLMKELELATKA